MRKILLLLALLMLAMTLTAFAAEYYEFSEPAYAGLYGRDLNLSFQRVRTGSGSGVLLVPDENGEVMLDGVGIRDMLYWEHPGHCFFPLAVSNEYGEWLYAVFMLEGLLTLGVFALCITLFKKHRFLRSLFYLCLLQILCESLRSDSFTWLFVKVEQLIGMLGVAGVLLVYCVKTPCVRRHWMPIIYCFPVAAVFVVLEFALNGKIPLSKPLCYAIMLAGLVLLSLNEIWAFRRMESKK